MNSENKKNGDFPRQFSLFCPSLFSTWKPESIKNLLLTSGVLEILGEF
jgi:hypothetical protein